MSTVLAHTVVAVAILIAYTVLTATGYDGYPLLAFLGGQGVGAIVQAKTGA